MKNLNNYRQYYGKNVNTARSIDLIKQLGGTHLGTYEIPFSDLVYGAAHQPARAGEDKNHIRELASDIVQRGGIKNMKGLLEAPTVKFDSAQNKPFKTLDSHHRLSAIEEIIKDSKINPSSVLVPCVVADFGSRKIAERKFSTLINRHAPRKAGGQKAAVRHLVDLYNLGAFPSTYTDEQLKTACYQEVDACFTTCNSPASKTGIWKKFKNAIGKSNVATITASKAAEVAKAHFGVEVKNKTVYNTAKTKAYMSGTFTALDKGLLIALKNFSTDLVQNKQRVPFEASILAYSNRDSQNSVLKERKSFLRHQAGLNLCGWKTGTLMVREIAFVGQLYNGSASSLEALQCFRWNGKEWVCKATGNRASY
jgi:hypothetical protein